MPGKGLFGKIHWTDIGRKLIENRVFRWLSPSWYLDKNTHEPVEMTSVALTNKPSQAGRIEPIVNSQPIELTDNKEEYEMTMTKEELVSLIKETVAVMNAQPVKEEVEEAVVENACSEDKAEEPVENECSDDKAEKPVENECEKDANVVKNEDTPEEVKEEVKEEIVEEVKEEAAEPVKEEVEEEKKEEVIKLEALNSTPKTEGIDIVKNFAPTPKQAKGYAITTIVR